MARPDLKNVAMLLVCLGPVFCVVAYLTACYFTYSPIGEPSDEKADFYQHAAIFCVTLGLFGGVTFFVGLALSSYLVVRKVTKAFLR